MTSARLHPQARSLAERFVPLARQLAWRATRAQDLPFDDVYSDALWGLTKAASSHAPDRPFAPYASRCIEGAILHGKRRRSGMRADRKIPRPALLRLDAPALGLSDATLATTLPDERTPTPAQQAERAALWHAVAGLPAPLRASVELYYRWDLTQGQIAETLRISQMQVSRRLTRARELLAESLTEAA